MPASHCKINPRPKTKLAKQEICSLFQGIPVADICDAMGRNAAFPSSIKPIGNAKLLGSAYTVRLPASENLLLYYALDNAQSGDVLVISCSGYEERAVCGEIMAIWAQHKQLSGFIVDGAIRDVEALRSINFPIFAKSITPNGPYKYGVGEINTPVNIGNIVVNPGDIIIGDDDGLIAIPYDEADIISKEARKIKEKGIKKINDILNKGKPDLEWLYKFIKQNNIIVK